MNEHERDRIAAAMNQARPDWPIKQLHTLLSDARLSGRARRDVFVALAWVACEPSTASPYRVLEAGPWWRAAAIEGQAQPREPFDASTFCGTCGEPRARCELKSKGDHEFEAIVHSRRRKGAADIAPVVVELKDHLQHRDQCAVKGPHDMFGHKAGLTNRYRVEKIHDPKGKHAECRYFVLDPQHDPLARIALQAYADAAERASTGQYGWQQPYRALVRDLRAWLRRLGAQS